MLPGGSAVNTATPESPVSKRRKFSAAAIRRMREAQQRRWAKIRGESEPPEPAKAEPSKPKRRLSKAGRANIVAALKKRWATKKAASVKAAPAVAKKSAVKKTAAKKAPAKAAKKAAPAAVEVGA